MRKKNDSCCNAGLIEELWVFHSDRNQRSAAAPHRYQLLETVLLMAIGILAYCCWVRTKAPQTVAFTVLKKLVARQMPKASNPSALNSCMMLLRLVQPFLLHFFEADLINYPIGHDTSSLIAKNMEGTKSTICRMLEY